MSPSERWFWIIDRLSPANCVARVRVHGRVSMARLEAAAVALLAEYPLLRMGIVDDAGRNPELTLLDAASIPLRRVVGADDEAWVREIDTELRTPIDLGKGLVRMVDIVSAAGTVHEFHDLVLTVSHIIGDGRSLVALLRKLVGYAGANSDTPVPERNSIPPADDLIPRAARGFWRYVATNLFDVVGGRLAGPIRLTSATVALPQRRTRIVHRVLEREALADLVSDCRRADVTVHGVLAAAVGSAIGRASGAVVEGIAGIGSPVDFRAELHPRPDPDELGVYAPVLIGYAPFGPGVSLWDAARGLKRQLDMGIRQRRHLSTVAGMRFATPRSARAGARIASALDRRAPWNVSVTNLGRVEFPSETAGLRLSGLLVAASNSCVSVLTVAVATAHDEMHITFCYVEDMLSARQTDEFADAVLTELRERPQPSAVPQQDT
ncbi:condensation domain-containing protein [Nocardia heshunensis]